MLKAFKTTFSGFLHSVPVYNAIGGTRRTIRLHGLGGKRIVVDKKYPYDSLSAEAEISPHEFHYGPPTVPRHTMACPSYRAQCMRCSTVPSTGAAEYELLERVISHIMPAAAALPNILRYGAKWIERELAKAEREIRA